MNDCFESFIHEPMVFAHYFDGSFLPNMFILL